MKGVLEVGEGQDRITGKRGGPARVNSGKLQQPPEQPREIAPRGANRHVGAVEQDRPEFLV